MTKTRRDWRWSGGALVLLLLVIQLGGCTKEALKERGLEFEKGKVKRVFKF